jgi:large subunit ribosomal protein L3
MGSARCTVRRLEVLRVDPERNLLLIKGAVPGGKDGLLMVTESVPRTRKARGQR